MVFRNEKQTCVMTTGDPCNLPMWLNNESFKDKWELAGSSQKEYKIYNKHLNN